MIDVEQVEQPKLRKKDKPVVKQKKAPSAIYCLGKPTLGKGKQTQTEILRPKET